MDSPLVIALLAVLVIIIVLVVQIAAVPRAGFAGPSCSGCAAGFAGSVPESCKKCPGASGAQRPLAATRETMAVSGDQVHYDDAPERRSVYSALNRLYSTADVDPLITGQLYDYSDGIRNVYAQRSAHGDGLAEYSSSGTIGDVGVDVGPFGLDEYGGKESGFDDGIPAQWAFPSTPVRWYAPKQRDYYGPEGPTPYAQGLYTLSEPDHDPLMP
jgi:hypothetical protein